MHSLGLFYSANSPKPKYIKHAALLYMIKQSIRSKYLITSTQQMFSIYAWNLKMVADFFVLIP